MLVLAPAAPLPVPAGDQPQRSTGNVRHTSTRGLALKTVHAAIMPVPGHESLAGHDQYNETTARCLAQRGSLASSRLSTTTPAPQCLCFAYGFSDASLAREFCPGNDGFLPHSPLSLVALAAHPGTAPWPDEEGSRQTCGEEVRLETRLSGWPTLTPAHAAYGKSHDNDG